MKTNARNSGLSCRRQNGSLWRRLTPLRRYPTIESGNDNAEAKGCDRIDKRSMSYFSVLAVTAVLSGTPCQGNLHPELFGQITRTVRPFLGTHYISCHGQRRPAAQLDLRGFTTMTALVQDGRRWSQILERLKAEEMPPTGARQPMTQERRAAVDWFTPSANVKHVAMPETQASCWRAALALPSTTTRSAI